LREAVIRDRGLEFATDAFGDSADSPVLLIMGGGASMLWWPQAFCERLASRGRFVIRYDQRDCGRSTKFAEGDARYTLDDLAGDAMRVLDEYAIPAVHLVGFSLGGIVAQLAALEYPSRVRSLTVIESSPVGMDTSHLPQSSETYRNYLAAAEEVDWSDRQQVIDYTVGESRVVAGAAHPFDEARVRKFIEEDYDRAGGYSTLSSFSWQGGEKWQGRLHELQAPLLVIHGTADPVYPIEHGVALAEAVAGAKLVRLEGGGHELHPADWDTIIGVIVTHTRTE
jgi:pimeloyl-ACP methyl ester carboxylesterase